MREHVANHARIESGPPRRVSAQVGVGSAAAPSSRASRRRIKRERRRGFGDERADVRLAAAALDVVLAQVKQVALDLRLALAAQVFGPDREAGERIDAEIS